MSRATTRMLKTALTALHFSGLGSLVSPLTRGHGVIFTLHQVLPGQPGDFDPNGILRVTPEWLEAVLVQVRESGFDVVPIDEAADRVAGRITGDRPFACFTFDDGYRDNLTFAYPVLKRHNVPFTIYVPTDFPDGRGVLWWLVLEEIVRKLRHWNVDMDGIERTFVCGTAGEKRTTYDTVYWWLRNLPEGRARNIICALAEKAGVDVEGMCRSLIMNWDELRCLSKDPLVTIGAHTKGHFAIAKLSEHEARLEIAESIARVEEEIGLPCRHFSFPYGDETSATKRDFEIAESLGLKTAVTTRKGLIHRDANVCATGLPRVSLNGDYQRRRYIDVLLTGAPFAFWNAFRRIQPSN